MKKKQIIFLIILGISCTLIFTGKDSTYSNNLTLNIAGVTEWGYEGSLINPLGYGAQPEMCSDGAGGAIIVWEEGDMDEDIYAQRIASNGKKLWGPLGTIISNDSAREYQHDTCSDGEGGALTAWVRNLPIGDEIYVQKINSSGDIQWKVNGVSLTNQIGFKSFPEICSDGSGGAIICWRESGTCVQRVDSNGNILWGENGTKITGESSSMYLRGIYGDGIGNVIIIIQTSFNIIYAQKINSSGMNEWGINGTLIGPTDQFFFCNPSVDNVGNSYIAWVYQENIYSQKVDSSGTILWEINGTVICNEDKPQLNPFIISDEKGGAFIAWNDNRSDTRSIYAQHVNSQGNFLWTLNGTLISDTTQGTLRGLVLDGDGGIIISWDNYVYDIYAGDYGYGESDIFAQRINVNGTTMWINGGIPICTVNGTQNFHDICSDGAQGIIAVWQDFREPGHVYIYYQNLAMSIPKCNNPEDISTTNYGAENINWILTDGSGGGYYRVLANDTSGKLSVWINWTQWEDISLLNIPINRSVSGNFNYTIEYYNYQNEFGISDSVIVRVDILYQSGGQSISGYEIISLVIISSTTTIIYLWKKKYYKK